MNTIFQLCIIPVYYIKLVGNHLTRIRHCHCKGGQALTVAGYSLSLCSFRLILYEVNPNKSPYLGVIIKSQ